MAKNWNRSLSRKFLSPSRTAANHQASSRLAIQQLEDRLTPSISIAAAGQTYSQNFDGLPFVGTYPALNSNLPIDLTTVPYSTTGMDAGDWFFARWSGGSDTTRFGIDNGTSTTGSVFSYGTTNSAERALGVLASGSNESRIGAVFVNNSGQTLTSFTLDYIGEQWRRGSDAANTLIFEYAVGGIDIHTGNFFSSTVLNFTSPSNAGSDAATIGNDVGFRTAVSGTVSGLNWQPGQTLVIRWSDTDDGGSDDGLAIDNLTFTASATPLPNTLYVNDDWSSLAINDPIADADLGESGDQSAEFGVTAFSTIAQALTVAGPDAVIVLNAGTYSETVTLTGAQKLVIAEAGTTSITGLTGSAGQIVDIRAGAMRLSRARTDLP